MEDSIFSEWMIHSNEPHKGNAQELPDSPLLGVAMDFNNLHKNHLSASHEEVDSFSPFAHNNFFQFQFTKDLIPSPIEEDYSSPSTASPPPSSGYSLFLDGQDTFSEFTEQGPAYLPTVPAPVPVNTIPNIQNIAVSAQLSESGSYSVPSSLTSSPSITSSSIVPTYNSPQQVTQTIEEQNQQYYDHSTIPIDIQKTQAFFAQSLNVHNKMINNNSCPQFQPTSAGYIQPLSLCDLNNTIKLNPYYIHPQFQQIQPADPMLKSEFRMSPNFLEQQRIAQEQAIFNSKNNVAVPQYCSPCVSSPSSTNSTPYSYSPDLTSSTPPAIPPPTAVPQSAAPHHQPNARTNKSGNKPRKLIEICDLFIKEYSNAALAGNNQVYIDLFAMKHGVDLTRMYSILHVMKCIGIIEKRGHNSYHWIGMEAISAAISAIFHSPINYLTGKPEFACEKCKLRESSKHHHQSASPDQQFSQSDDSDSDSDMTDRPSKTNPITSPKLSHIYKQFIKQFFLNPNVSCKDAKEMYNIQLTTAKSRRLYDMALILDSINLITKDDASKNKIQYYKWKGSPTIEELRQSPCHVNANVEDDE